MLDIMKNFIKENCVSRLCALERVWRFPRLHLQMVCKIYIFSLVTLNKLMKECLSWDDVSKAPPRHHVHCKVLRGVGMHTYTSNVRYCFGKTKGKNIFNFVTLSMFKKCMKLTLAKIEFVWHIAVSWKELQHFANTKWKRKLMLLL